MDMAMSTMIPNSQPSYATNDIAERVLRRVQVAKVARSLQDRLALANFKAQNGWQDQTFRPAQPELLHHLQKKRPHTRGDTISETSSIDSDDPLNSISPLAASAFSDESSISRRSHHSQHQHQILQTLHRNKKPRVASTSASARPATRTKTWEQTRQLPQSSPVFQRPRLPFSNSSSNHATNNATSKSRLSKNTQLRGSLEEPAICPGDGENLNMGSFEQEPDLPTYVPSSPPRTPSPSRQLRKSHLEDTGADLLLHLANSPVRSPRFAHHSATRSKYTGQPSNVNQPSTPPSQKTLATNNPPLPSSFLSTPNTATSGVDLPLFSTPGQNLNFAEFCHLTPSPAQVNWAGRTPGTGVNKTPTMRTGLTRRGLNFDALVPPSATSSGRPGEVGGGLSTPKRSGLALDLGDKMLPSS